MTDGCSTTIIIATHWLTVSSDSIRGADVTRRWFYLVPAEGEPRKLVHRIETARLDALPGAKAEYSSWQELEAQLEKMLAGVTHLAMQYSPRNAIMYVSMVDAGTVEMLRDGQGDCEFGGPG